MLILFQLLLQLLPQLLLQLLPQLLLQLPQTYHRGQKYGVAGPCKATLLVAILSAVVCLPKHPHPVVYRGRWQSGWSRRRLWWIYPLGTAMRSWFELQTWPVADAGGQCEPASPDALPDIRNSIPVSLAPAQVKSPIQQHPQRVVKRTAGYDHDTSPSPPAQEVQLPVSSTATAGINYGVSTASSTTAYQCLHLPLQV
ncbi:hypothetical protein BSLG_006114 [Batrachochytrium salamandrivorans]|nr:hypothetical protein BSLG_006114 [Batrachochytrium salamandrivorans]